MNSKLFLPALAPGFLLLLACNRSAQTINAAPDAQTVSARPGTGAGCLLVEDGAGPAGKVKVRVEEVASGLDVPWAIAFLPGGDMLVSERSGAVRLVRDGKLQPGAIATIKVTASGEGGLLGLAAHPDFARNRYFYVYFTADVNGSPVNRVERWQLSPDGRGAKFDRPIIDNIPVAQFHNGGRIRFGPDGLLYIGTGDAREPDLSQDPKSLAGKILRVTPDGRVPADNPFPGSPVYITGIRNTQGFDWPGGKTMWVSDHGPSGDLGRYGHDKVSVAKAGDNLGWPVTHGCESKPGYVTPAIVWRQALPPGGVAIYTGDKIPEWRGGLLVASLRGEHLQRVAIAPDGQVTSHEVYFKGEYGRLREAIMGPDGDLYITTSNCDGRGSCGAGKDKILRVTR